MSNNRRNKELSNSVEMKKLTNFLEELSWLMESYQGLDFHNLREIRNNLYHMNDMNEVTTSLKKPPNANVHYLVGILPSLFLDTKIFNSNSDIAEFASEVLFINIPRWSKKSKFEIIGHILCATTELNDSKVSDLVEALQHVVNGNEKIKKRLTERKNNGLTWNMLIRDLNAQ